MPDDLVDYLRDKLAHADDVVCTCGTIDVRNLGDWHAPPIRRLDQRCPVHGKGGTDPVLLMSSAQYRTIYEPPKRPWWRR